jgi:hypothetical protein
MKIVDRIRDMKFKEILTSCFVFDPQEILDTKGDTLDEMLKKNREKNNKR